MMRNFLEWLSSRFIKYLRKDFFLKKQLPKNGLPATKSEKAEHFPTNWIMELPKKRSLFLALLKYKPRNTKETSRDTYPEYILRTTHPMGLPVRCLFCLPSPQLSPLQCDNTQGRRQLSVTCQPWLVSDHWQGCMRLAWRLSLSRAELWLTLVSTVNTRWTLVVTPSDCHLWFTPA